MSAQHVSTQQRIHTAQGADKACGTTEDCYGKPLTFGRARVVATILAAFGDPPGHGEAAGRLRAIAAYMRALPPRTRVVLFWK